MILILCVDDRGGLMFNRRRQSQDRLVRQDMLHLCGARPLAVSPYTARQFGPEDGVKVVEQPGEEDIFFLEDLSPSPFWSSGQAHFVPLEPGVSRRCPHRAASQGVEAG